MSAATQSIPEASAPRWMSLTRWHAFAIHLVLSFLVFFSLVAVMYFYWFPGELFFLDGGWQGLKLVALVDLVLGPLLTLLLFVPTKPKVLMDMAFIAVFQIAALVYGAITTFDQRTIAMVYTDKMFASLSNAALEVADKALLEKEITPKDISKLNPGRPDLLYTRSPTQETYANYLEEMFNGYPEPHERSDKLQSIHAGREEMKKYAVTDTTLQEFGWLESVNAEVKNKALTRSELEFHNYRTRYSSGIAIYDLTSHRIVDYVPLEKPAQEDSTPATAENSAN